MEDLPKYYTILFTAMTKAIDALNECDYGLAKRLLIQGQQAAEDAYLEQDE